MTTHIYNCAHEHIDSFIVCWMSWNHKMDFANLIAKHITKVIKLKEKKRINGKIVRQIAFVKHSRLHKRNSIDMINDFWWRHLFSHENIIDRWWIRWINGWMKTFCSYFAKKKPKMCVYLNCMLWITSKPWRSSGRMEWKVHEIKWKERLLNGWTEKIIELVGEVSCIR